MHIFVTGATGFIGSAVVQELIRGGHRVVGLARSDEGARGLAAAAGAEVHRGDLEDADGLRRGAAAAEGVIHPGFNHDFSKFAANCETDRLAIEALGSGLAGTNRPLIVSAGIGPGQPGRPKTENDPPAPPSDQMPRVSEGAAMDFQSRGVRVSVVRLPQVHDAVKQGLVTYAVAREKGVSTYVGEGQNRWAAAPRLDVARLYRLVVEKGVAGASYHAVAEEGVPFRDIAAAVGRGLNVPVVSVPPEAAAGHFGWLAGFAAVDMPASSAATRERLGWHPTGPGLIADLDRMDDSVA